ncbi:MAG TPA: amino acid ABC transporter ATP-binding protein [Treponemataceae bacterium]|mgnify:FL=1|jgi:polar amino acid transport system ATP-binding protein|nr:MAG: Glutamine transport ATP-binding protein GlnQ [Spirochaetes bacterium ADurb.Bin269]TAH55402.1 MAG: amino acid ABC transporter ATP-binding protein [Treponema sp.]HOC28474.1 amino acid ABC transporter ATP-binding protein [Treponemataceae bacterium]HPX47558.1 amino acid ABC transporter ATP-binding protein [Treponemataceae bacterium]
MEILNVSHLSKSFGDLEVLKDISFSVHRGEVLSIIGPSGSGKSTLLRCVNHLETVSGGTISVLGSNMVADGAYATPAELRAICLKVGLVFQNFNLFPHFSVLRNITEAQLRVLGRTSAEANRRALSLLDKMGLSDKIHAYPCELSGGQQQRVSIARALALDPEVLFFDEPTSALDPELTGEILKVIRDLAAEKMTMVIVTHEMSFARDVADRVIFMDSGVIVEEGIASEVINNPKNERTRLFLRRFSE